MHIHEGIAPSGNGYGQFYRRWRPSRPKAFLVVTHGFGEHSGRYAHFAEYLVSRGYAVYAHDLVGHGRSSGQRGHIDSWTDYWHALAIFRNFAQACEPSLPSFLFGHSMGGLVVLSYLTMQPLDIRGAIVSGALLEPGSTANPLLVAAARLLSANWPALSFKLGLNIKALSRDPAVIEAYRNDPLVHGRASVRWGTEVLNAMGSLKTQVKRVVDPLLILHGEADAINRVEGAHWLFREVSSIDKELRIYPGGYHEPLNDLQKEQVLHDIADWFDRHL